MSSTKSFRHFAEEFLNTLYLSKDFIVHCFVIGTKASLRVIPVYQINRCHWNALRKLLLALIDTVIGDRMADLPICIDRVGDSLDGVEDFRLRYQSRGNVDVLVGVSTQAIGRQAQ